MPGTGTTYLTTEGPKELERREVSFKAAFADRGVNAHTILTYGQSLDARSRHSKDQTRLFSNERWVRFAFTPRAIKRDLLRSYRVSGRD